MKKRIITALILAFILIPVILVPELLVILDFVLILFAVVAACELLNMYDKQKKISLPIKIITVLLTLVLYFAIVNSFAACKDSIICKFLDLINADKILNPMTALCAIFIILMTGLVFSSKVDVADIGKFYLAIIYVGVSVGAFTVLRYYGVRFVIYLLCVSIATDIFALVFGLTLGKHKMAPKISPKKTWEGAIGGTAVALIVGFCFLYFYPNFSHVFHDGVEGIQFFDTVFMYRDFSGAGKVFFVLVLTLAMSICSQTGDLVASKLKRSYGIKDYSNVFPGHGGVLDRFDSTFFSSAIFLLFMIAESNLFPWVL